MTIKQIGVDIGKTTFHVIGMDDDDRIVLRKQFSRSQLVRYFEQCRCDAHRVAFEACSGATGWHISWSRSAMTSNS